MAVHQPTRAASRSLSCAFLLPRIRGGTGIVLVLVLAACGTTMSPSPPTAAWPRGTVEQPREVTSQPSTGTAYCAPCHPSVITQMRDVAATAEGFVAIGSQTPISAVVWTSSDGQSWRIAVGFPDPADQRLNAVAVKGTTSVIVGRGPRGVAAWVSTTPGQWQAATVPTAEGSITAVTATTDGFVAGGYLGPEFGAADSAVWRSPDGLTWSRVRDAVGLADGRISGVATTSFGIVAVGTSGDPGDGRAASWVSNDGEHWARANSQDALIDGAMLSVAPTSTGVVAVGRIGSGDRSAAWTSSDGLSWNRAPDLASFGSSSTYAPHAEMSDVVATRNGLLAVGWNSSSSNGSAVVWRSTDGLTWTRDPDEPGLSGGGMSGVAVGRDSIVAVGSTGWPDTHAGTAWDHRL